MARGSMQLHRLHWLKAGPARQTPEVNASNLQIFSTNAGAAIKTNFQWFLTSLHNLWSFSADYVELLLVDHSSAVGTSLQQNDFNKEIHKDKAYETIDNTYEDLSIEMPKVQTLWKDKNDLWTWMIWKH